jgi:hypothetical protein
VGESDSFSFSRFPILSVKGIIMILRHRLFLIASIASLAAGIILASTSHAKAQAVDPAGDFLPTYTGPLAGDLDVLSTGATWDGINFRFFATLNGAVGTTNGAFYVWGVDRGAGTVGFAALAPGVTFDTVVIARTSLVTPSNPARATGTAAGTALAPGAVTFSGNTISVIVPTALLPSTGRGFSDYTINLWPRATGPVGTNAISDFAPNNSNVRVTTTAPEPGSLGLAVIGGIGLLGGTLRRRRRH